MGICLAFVVIMSFIAIRCKLGLKKSGYIMVAICAISEISKIMSDMETADDGGMVLNPKSLPFHLCSLMIFVIIYVTFGKEGKLRQLLIDFLALAGTLGSVCAILIPTNGTDFADIGAYQCFVYHAGLLWFALYLIIGKHAKLGARALGRNTLILSVLVVAMLYINSVLSAYGTNFMYIVRPPMENLPYLNLDHGWYVYFIHLVCAGVLIISLFHLPFVISDIIRKKRNIS